jgi:hypothetical protein
MRGKIRHSADVPQETGKRRFIGHKGGQADTRSDGRTNEMMYMTLTVMAGLITVMFVATAVSSIVTSIRENDAARRAALRRAAF